MTTALNINYLDVCQKLEKASQHYSEVASSIQSDRGNQRPRRENLSHLAVILAEDIKENRPLVLGGVKGKSAVTVHISLEQIAQELGVGIFTLKAYLHSISTYTNVTYKPRAA